MEETQNLELSIAVEGGKETRSSRPSAETIGGTLSSTTRQLPARERRKYWWIQIAIYTVLVLGSQSATVLLGRLYFSRGGKSEWLATLVVVIGFPILLPLYYIIPKSKTHNHDDSPGGGSGGRSTNRPPPDRDHPSPDPAPASKKLLLATVYVGLGLLVAAYSMLYSIGLRYLPTSTYSLICASQLAFNALFGFFLNAQKLTAYIVNSLVLLTLSSILLVFDQQKKQQEDDQVSNKKSNYAIGFACTVVASAGFGLLLSLTHLFFHSSRVVIKRHDFRVVLDLIIYQSLVASCTVVVGLFVSGDWKTIKGEMDEFESGRLSYLMTLLWIALSWQIYGVGTLALILHVSALFSNVVSTMALPITPILAFIFYHDQLGSLKLLSMFLAMWAFISYAYHHYLCPSITTTT